MTNLSLLDNSLLSLFRKYRPLRISTTLYGMSPDTYARFTGCPSAYNRIIAALQALKQEKHTLFVKVIANNVNKNELDKMHQYLQEQQLPFFFYYNIINYADGDTSPKKLQLPCLTVIEHLFKYGALQELALKIKAGQKHLGGNCKIGIHSFSIDPQGNMYLCELADSMKLDLLDLGFNQCWNQLFAERNRIMQTKTPCSSCQYRKYCSVCTPKLLYEQKSLQPLRRDCYRARLLKSLVEGPWTL